MRQSARMQGKRAFLDAFSAHKISCKIIKHLIGINIGMIIGYRNGFRVIIKHSGHKTAYDKLLGLKRLMHRRGLVYATGNGLKIIDTKGIGI